MDRPAFAGPAYQAEMLKTRRKLFLEQLNDCIPRKSLDLRIRSRYPRARKVRHTYCLAVILWVPQRSC